VVSLFLFGVITALLVDANGNQQIHPTTGLVKMGSAGHVATAMFRNYLVPFEVVSMLLLAALVGAVVIARKD
jgi:NADH-quinone oxidoreductase subunit J